MAKKPKPAEPEKPNPSQLLIDERYLKQGELEKFQGASDAELAEFGKQLSARAMSQPEVRAASVIQAWDGDSLDINCLSKELREQVAEVGEGNMARPEAILTAQAHTLDALFGNLARRSKSNSSAGYLDAAEKYMRLALKAQAQAVRTIEALGELKNPRQVTFVRQANLAQNQQVNNHPSQGGRFEKTAEQTINGASYELLENPRTQGFEGAINPSVETLGEIDRAEVARGQSQGVPERI